VLRQFLTSGDDSFGDRFPQIFVLDRAITGDGDPTRRVTAIGGGPIPPAARHAITDALAHMGPVAFAASPDAVIVDRNRCARVRDQGAVGGEHVVEGHVSWPGCTVSCLIAWLV